MYPTHIYSFFISELCVVHLNFKYSIKLLKTDSLFFLISGITNLISHLFCGLS